MRSKFLTAVFSALMLVNLACHQSSNETKPDPKPVDPPKTIEKYGRFRTVQNVLQQNALMSGDQSLLFSNTPMTINRMGHTAITLRDGRVLLVGGANLVGLNQLEIPADQQIQVFDPATETFQSVVAPTSMNIGQNPTAVELTDGTVYILSLQAIRFDPVLMTAEVLTYAVDTGATSFYVEGSFVWWHPETRHVYDTTTGLTTVTNGDFRIPANGSRFVSPYTLDRYVACPSWIQPRNDGSGQGDYVFDNHVWKVENDLSLTTVGVFQSKYAGSSFIFLDATHLARYGGVDENRVYSTMVEIMDITTGISTTVGSLPMGVASAFPLRLQNGYSFLAGGQTSGAVSGSQTINTQIIYDHTTNTSGYTNVMNRKRTQFSATLLNTGRILIVGGENEETNTTPVTEIFEPESAIYIKVPAGRPWDLNTSVQLVVETTLTDLVWSCDLGTVTQTGLYTFPDKVLDQKIDTVVVTVKSASNPDVNKASVYLQFKRP